MNQIEPGGGGEEAEHVEPERLAAAAERVEEDPGDHEQRADDERHRGAVVAARTFVEARHEQLRSDDDDPNRDAEDKREPGECEGATSRRAAVASATPNQ